MAFDRAALEDDDPHLEVGSLFDQHVFLCREEPEKIAAANLVTAITEQISSRASGDEVQLEFGVVVAPVGSRRGGVAPDHAVEFGRKIKTLQHGDKK